MEGADFNWKKSRAQQRRKEKRKKDFTHKNKNVQDPQEQETTVSDKIEESTDVRTSETEVPKENREVKNGLNEKNVPTKEGEGPKEKPVVDFSNLKRETEEIEKLVKKNQYEISSNWERYVASENKEDVVYNSEEPADILNLLQSPSSYGGHFLLKEEQDWTAASKMLLSGFFALDLKRLARGLSCIPFYIRHDLPENIFSAEEMEQMTYGLTKRRADYFRSVKEETGTDKNRNVSENTCNENILQLVKEDSDKTNIKHSEVQCLDDCIIRSDKKNEKILNMESDYNSDDNIQKNNAFSVENYVEASSKTNQSPVKEEISFVDKSERKHTEEVAVTNNKHHADTKLENNRNPLPVPVVASETFDNHVSATRESRTPEKTVDRFQKTVDSDRSSSAKERKERSDSSEPVFSSNVTDSKKDSNRGENDIQSVKENERTTTLSKPISSSITTENRREDSTLKKTAKKPNFVADDLDFLLSIQDPVKKQPSVSVRQVSGTSYVPAPKVTPPASKVEKDESLEDWLDSVLNG